MCLTNSGSNKKCFIPCSDVIRKCGNCSCQNRIINEHLNNSGIGDEEMLKVIKIVEKVNKQDNS